MSEPAGPDSSDASQPAEDVMPWASEERERALRRIEKHREVERLRPQH
jgi:hypothetical protein